MKKFLFSLIIFLTILFLSSCSTLKSVFSIGSDYWITSICIEYEFPTLYGLSSWGEYEILPDFSCKHSFDHKDDKHTIYCESFVKKYDQFIKKVNLKVRLHYFVRDYGQNVSGSGQTDIVLDIDKKENIQKLFESEISLKDILLKLCEFDNSIDKTSESDLKKLQSLQSMIKKSIIEVNKKEVYSEFIKECELFDKNLNEINSLKIEMETSHQNVDLIFEKYADLVKGFVWYWDEGCLEDYRKKLSDDKNNSQEFVQFKQKYLSAINKLISNNKESISDTFLKPELNEDLYFAKSTSPYKQTGVKVNDFLNKLVKQNDLRNRKLNIVVNDYDIIINIGQFNESKIILNDKEITILPKKYDITIKIVKGNGKFYFSSISYLYKSTPYEYDSDVNQSYNTVLNADKVEESCKAFL